MNKLFKVEVIKTIGYPTFWAILLLHALFYVLVIALGAKLNLNIQGVEVFRLFSYDHIWGTMAWIASWFNLLLAILIIVLTGNELMYKTYRRQLLDGLTRGQLIFGKLMLIACLSVYVVLLVTISGFMLGSAVGTWQDSYSVGFQYVFVLGLQSIAYMTFAMLTVFVFRNVGLSVVIYLLYFILVEPFIRLFFTSNVDKFFPIKIISNLTPMPDFMAMLAANFSGQGMDTNSAYQIQSVPNGISMDISVPVCVVYIVMFVVVSGLLVKYRDF